MWAEILNLKSGDLCSVSPGVNCQCGKNTFLSLLFLPDAVRRVKSELKVNFSLRHFPFISFPAVLSSAPSFLLPLNHIFRKWIITEVWKKEKKIIFGRGCLEINKLESCWRAAGLSVSKEGGEGVGGSEKTALHINTMLEGLEGTVAEEGASKYNKQER